MKVIKRRRVRFVRTRSGRPTTMKELEVSSKQVTNEYLESKYEDSPELQTQLKELLLAGWRIDRKSPHGFFACDNHDADGDHKMWVWRIGDCWKIQYGHINGVRPPACVQCETLDEILFYLRHWLKCPPMVE